MSMMPTVRRLLIGCWPAVTSTVESFEWQRGSQLVNQDLKVLLQTASVPSLTVVGVVEASQDKVDADPGVNSLSGDTNSQGAVEPV